MSRVQDAVSSRGKDGGRRSVPTLVLLLGFTAAFLAALAAFIFIGHIAFDTPRTLIGSPTLSTGVESDAVNQKLQTPDFHPFSVDHGGMYLKAMLGQRGNPVPSEDFAVFVWFRLRKLPDIGESVSLIGKFDADVMGRPGYAVSLEGAPDGVRPRVYLSAGQAPGRWYSFSSHPMNRRDWYVLTMGIERGTFVSTALGRAYSPSPLVLLGGHRIDEASLPRSEADLVLGAFGAGRFRGQLGPFGVLSGKGLSKQIPTALKYMQADPVTIPKQLASDMIRVWGSPAEDRGPGKIAIVTVSGESKRERNKSSQLSNHKPKKKVSRQSSSRKLKSGGEHKKVTGKSLR